jgi:hypothetical protein
VNERELLELAAKAAGVSWLSYHLGKGMCCRNSLRHGGLIEYWWNPRADDGDALRLAVQLDLSIFPTDAPGRALVERPSLDVLCGEPHGNDKNAAVRLAIVRAAAEIGRARP